MLSNVYPVLILSLVVAPHGTAWAQQLRNVHDYHGFRVYYGEVQANPKFETLRTAVNKQIDMVTAVGVPPKILNFLRESQ